MQFTSYNVLNVAEKPSVAKEIARHLSSSSTQHVHSHSKYNPVAAFSHSFMGRQCEMHVTSVRGHLMELEFAKEYKNWTNVNPLSLFRAPVHKSVKSDCGEIEKNLKTYAQKSSVLVLWLDCDREGENIAHEVIDVCLKANPSLCIYRAHFSALTRTDICRAWETLAQPNPALSEAVDCRQELDLRIGAALTRFLTLRYQRQFNLPSKVISFGPCQFPTLGFVVERYLQHHEFQSEPFWNLTLKISTRDRSMVEFTWSRGRLFDRHIVQIFKTICERASTASVVTVNGNPVTKHKPLPLTTTEMAILASRKLRISSKLCMSIADALYQRGLISYPRTETNKFTPTMDIKQLVSIQNTNTAWGAYAQSLIESGKYRSPSKGNNDDKAHPPIHPVKSCDRHEFRSENEWRVYDLVTRHFLACCSDDAHGERTLIEIEIGGERFSATGLVIRERNYLEIYPFDQWTGRQLPQFSISDRFQSPPVEVIEGKTEPPPLLTEADLIKKMEKHGIGTDATMHEHIQTIQDRCYAEVLLSSHFVPTALGLALVKGFRGYARDWLDLAEPHLRAAMEHDMTLIATGVKQKNQVLNDTLDQMIRVYEVLSSDPSKLDSAMIISFKPRTPGEAGVQNRTNDEHNNLNNPLENILSTPVNRNGMLLPSPSVLTNLITTSFSKCRCGGMMSMRSPAPPPTLQIQSRASRGKGRGKRRPQQALQAAASSNNTERYLVCDQYQINSCPTLLLPRRGHIEGHRFLCPVCQYQVLKVANSSSKGFHYVCPYCFSFAPPHLFGRQGSSSEVLDIESPLNQITGQLRCFSCCHPVCDLAGGGRR